MIITGKLDVIYGKEFFCDNCFGIFDIIIVSRAFDSMRIDHDNITLHLGCDNLIQKVK